MVMTILMMNDEKCNLTMIDKDSKGVFRSKYGEKSNVLIKSKDCGDTFWVIYGDKIIIMNG